MDPDVGNVSLLVDVNVSSGTYLRGLIKKFCLYHPPTIRQLRVLLRVGGKTEADIAKDLRLQKHSATALLFGLQAKGLIDRHEADEVVKMTPKAQKLVADIASQLEEDTRKEFLPSQCKEMSAGVLKIAGYLDALIG